MMTSTISLSFGTVSASMKAPRRWIEEIATIEAATLSLSDPASSLPSRARFLLGRRDVELGDEVLEAGDQYEVDEQKGDEDEVGGAERRHRDGDVQHLAEELHGDEQ